MKRTQRSACMEWRHESKTKQKSNLIFYFAGASLHCFLSEINSARFVFKLLPLQPLVKFHCAPCIRSTQFNQWLAEHI